MAQAASLSILDRAATPVAHIFVYDGQKNGVNHFVEVGPVPFGQRRLTISNFYSNGKFRIVKKLSTPILVTEVVNGVSVPRVIDTIYSESKFTFSDRTTEAQRNEHVGIHVNAELPGQTVIHAMIVKLEQTY